VLLRCLRQERAIEVEARTLSEPGEAQLPVSLSARLRPSEQEGRARHGFLPRLEVRGLSEPAVRVFRQRDGELLYGLRLREGTFDPFVFEDGEHVLEVGSGEEGRWKRFEGLRPAPQAGARLLQVDF
jgi:hypothetical protein